MREVRPTIKVLKSLPRETFADTTPLDLIANSDYKRLDLYGLQHPLLEDARRRFASGVPSRHKSASRTYGAPVYEVRDRTGAGWRGAVVLDDAGDPWLVWVERHDHFHDKVADVAFADVMPSPAEYKLRAREEATSQRKNWEHQVLLAFIDGLTTSVRTKHPVVRTIPGMAAGQSAALEVEVMHDEPSGEVATAHTDQSVLTVSLRVGDGTWGDFQSALTRVCLPFLQPDPAKIEAVFGRDNALVAYVDITQAQLVQLLANPPAYEDSQPADVRAPDRLHYVGIDYLVAGYVNASPVRGVCGAWFIATRDETCGLPVCERCESEQPAAQAVIELLRSTD